MKRLLVVLAALAMALAVAAAPADAVDADLVRNARRGLDSLTASNSAARDLRKKAKAVLVFPRMIKAGFLFGGQIGDGVLFSSNGGVAGYYNSVAASYGLQAGGQTFGYALFFMNTGALDYLKKSSGWEIGSGPSVVVLDQGMAKSYSSTTLTQDVYAIIFNQKGLMAGVGIQGSKITRIDE
jgi:lipid-binding SYLF domain-containing protein